MKIITKILIFSLVMGMIFLSPASAQEHDMVQSDCTATESYTIGTADTGFAFNVSEIKVAKGACVEITFVNTQGGVAHDFTIDTDSENDIPKFHMHMDDVGSMTGTFQAPDADIDVEFYCSVPGHKDGGMVGTIIVGEGGSAPGFSFIYAFLAFFALFAIPKMRRK